MIVKVPVSVGELLDKVSILRIKLDKFQDEQRRANVRRELDALLETCQEYGLHHEDLETELVEVNTELWEVEDKLRVLESRADFGAEFIKLARGVYYTNDRRAAIKRRINEHFGSTLVEEKEYVKYQADEQA